MRDSRGTSHMSDHYQLSAQRVVLTRAEHLLKDSQPHLAQAALVGSFKIKLAGGKGFYCGETRCRVRIDPTRLTGPSEIDVSEAQRKEGFKTNLSPKDKF